MKAGHPSSRGRSWVGPVIGYFAVSLLFAWELLWPGRSLYRWDTLLYNWPVLLETREQLLSGHIPFWASSFCCGTPLLANINAGVLYPPRILCWVLPLKLGYHLFLFVHVWLGLVAAHLLFRRGMRLAWPAAMVGALTYGLSGYARAMWDTHNFMALPWIPLGLLALLGARDLPARAALGPTDARFRLFLRVVGTAVCWGMMVLCGDFQAACTWGGVALLLALLMPERGRLIAVLGFSAVLCALLTAPQWVCTAFASLESYRAGGLDFADATEFSLHPVRVLEMFMPQLFGTRDGWVGAVLAGEGSRKLIPWTTSIHVGRLALLAACLGLRQRRRPEVKWAAILCGVFLFLSFGRFLPGFRAWHSLPLVGSFRYPQKYLLWSTFGLAVLAAFGTQRLRALLCRADRPAMRVLRTWGVVLIAGAILASLVLLGLSTGAGNAAWLLKRWSSLAVVLIAVGLAARPGAAGRRAMILPAIVMLDLFLPWRLERPTTTAFDPLEMPVAARVIRHSPSPFGRLIRDPAVQGVPLLAGSDQMTWSERWAATQRASLDHNSPRLWGLRTAAGFSPLESGRMRKYRLAVALPEHGAVPEVQDFAHFCNTSAAEWVLTTSERAGELADRIGAAPVTEWGPGGGTVLLRVTSPSEAECLQQSRRPSGLPDPEVANVWRRRPGRIRVDLKPGARTRLTVKESFAAGWEATDELGSALRVMSTPEGLLSVSVPARTRQVRLAYMPRGWRLASLAGLSGLCLLAAMFCATVDSDRLKRLVRSRTAMLVLCGLLFIVVGTAARDRWTCTFDEGFHGARGIARLRTGDSRLSYFHPPLQNVVCGYFSNLAHGDRLNLPVAQGWESANVAVYATNLAGINRGIFPDLVRSGRWGSTLFSLVAIGAAIWLAAGIGGAAAGWLAGLGLGLSPAMLAHGNLMTTDAGVLAFALLGTCLLWRSTQQADRRALFWTTTAFVFGALVKFTGLIWLGAYLLLCIPLVAVQRKDRRVLWQIPVAVGMLLLLLVFLYGPLPQVIRSDTIPRLSGKSIVAGRYIEGLLSQAGHSASGHRAFFHGDRFMQGSWWHTPMSIVLKTPPLWLAAGCIGLVAAVIGARRRWAAWVPWLPVVVFTLLLIMANRMVIGIRHALPLAALGVIAAAVWAARLSRTVVRRAVLVLLAVSAVWTAASPFPHYISYFPAWAGGVGNGHRWLVDSNYDWGQDLEVLEEQWSMLTRANDGIPLRLVYFGFVDPLAVYEMPVAKPSLRGFMGRMRWRGYSFDNWVRDLSAIDDSAVASISALQLNPYGTDFARLRDADELGWVGNCFRVTLSEQFGESKANGKR